MGATNGIIVSQVTFGESGLEIIYLETREQSQDVGLVRTIMFDVSRQDMARVEDIIDSIEELLDEALIRVRNPQHKPKSARERAIDLGRIVADDAEEDE
jgi:hypothetical protein